MFSFDKITTRYNKAIREVETSRNIYQANEKHYHTEEKNFSSTLKTLTEAVAAKCQEMEERSWNSIERLRIISEDFGSSVRKYSHSCLLQAIGMNNTQVPTFY